MGTQQCPFIYILFAAAFRAAVSRPLAAMIPFPRVKMKIKATRSCSWFMAVAGRSFTFALPFWGDFFGGFLHLGSISDKWALGAEVGDLCHHQAWGWLETAVPVGKNMVKEQEFHMLQPYTCAFYTGGFKGQRRESKQPSWLFFARFNLCSCFSKHTEVLCFRV